MGHDFGFFFQGQGAEEGDQQHGTPMFGIAEGGPQGLAFHHAAIGEAFGSGLDLGFAILEEAGSGGQGEAVVVPVGAAFEAGGPHFGAVARLESEGGAVVFPGAVFEAFAAGDEVAHDALLVVHAEEGATGGDGGMVAADHGGKVFVATGGAATVGLGGIVGQTNAEIDLGIAQVNHRQVEGFPGDLAIADGDSTGFGQQASAPQENRRLGKLGRLVGGGGTGAIVGSRQGRQAKAGKAEYCGDR